MNPKKLGNLRSIRKELGKSQSQLANLLSISVRAVQSYEQGWRPTPPYVQKLAGLLLLIEKRREQGRLVPCWKIRNCDRETRTKCHAYKTRAGDLCWLVTGSNDCQGRKMPSWDAKFAECKKCDVMKQRLGS